MRRLFVIALALVAAGCRPAPTEKPDPFNAAALGTSIYDQEQKLPEEVAEHPFWRARVTIAQVSELVDRMRNEEGATVLIDDQFKVVVRHWADVQVAPNGRHIEIKMADYDARPTRLELLIKLKAKLDAEELPGR